MKDNSVFKQNSIGKRIARYRQMAGLTNKQLADIIGVTHSAITGFEQRNIPQTPNFVAICNAMCVSPDTLLQSTDKKSLLLSIEEYLRIYDVKWSNNLNEIEIDNREPNETVYDLEVFTTKLREYRNLLSLTQEAVAEKTEISAQYFSVLETGVKAPSMAVLRKLSFALEIPVACLLSDTEPMRFIDPETHERLKKLSVKELKRLAVVLEALANADEE